MKEDEIISKTQSLLDDFIKYVDNSVWKEQYSVGLRTLQQELTAPCVLAIAGKVKAGKSFLVNSLLGVDLAMTGTTETTATINIFKYGTSPYKDRPILCQYVDGSKEWKSKSYLDSLQGTSEKALAQTANIDRLTFYIDNNPFLTQVTLVDTPGIGADVGDGGDAHQVHTDSYFRLRRRHQQETVNLSGSADAMIYLFNTVPTQTDKDFLDALYDGGHGLTSLNGIGVLSKIDRDVTQIENIPRFKALFNSQLFTIVPTSATIFKYVPDLSDAIHLRDRLRAGFSTEQDLNLGLGSDMSFLHPALPNCKISVEERKAIKDSIATSDFSWSTFALIAKELYCTEDMEASLSKLRQLSGISELSKVINEHFFRRTRLLRCNKILTDIANMLKEMQYSDYYLSANTYAKIKNRCVEETVRLSPDVRNIVRDLIGKYLMGKEEADGLKEKIRAFKDRTERLKALLSLINDTYLAYQIITSNSNSLSLREEELAELRVLFSGQETINKNSRQRQQYWTTVYNLAAPNSKRQIVAKVAKDLYNTINQ